jgi:hypothetical protein
MFMFEVRKAINGYILVLDSYESSPHFSKSRILVFETWENLMKYLKPSENILNQEKKP